MTIYGHPRTLPPIGPWMDWCDKLLPLAQQDALYLRCEKDLALFALSYFPERFGLPFNEMHKAFINRAKVPWGSRDQQTKMADAAPRGGAKSTIESYASLVHDAVYGYEAFVPIFSTTYKLAENLVKDLYRTFIDPEAYPELHEAYGPFKVIGGQTDFYVRVPHQDPRGCRFAAFSAPGSSIRGEKHLGIRPTKIVIDDGEHPKRVRSPGQRFDLWEYLTKDILKAGWKWTVFRMLGTILHPDSMLSNVLRSPGWTSTKWRSVLSWPTDMAGWNRCRELWADRTDPERFETARDYYRRHRKAMDAGSKVLWPQSESLFDLFVMLWTDGEASFNSEKQNDPVDPTRQVYYPERCRKCVVDLLAGHLTTSKGRVVRLTKATVAVWLDPRAGQGIERGDYAALAVVVRDEFGYRYLAAMQMARASGAEQRAWMWQWFDQLGPKARYGYENNGFANLNDEGFDRERTDRQAANKPWRLSPKGEPSTENKMDRMVSLAADVENGWIEFANDLPREFWEQLAQLPASGAHDDGPDAWERAVWLADGGGMGEVQMGTLTG